MNRRRFTASRLGVAMALTFAPAAIAQRGGPTTAPTRLVPKETSINVKLWGTSNLFKKGRRIRVHITSSNFPRYARNLNSGKPQGEEAEQDIRIANTTVFHSQGRASAIVLPIVPNTPITP